jgi:hypothetical protein
MFDLSNSNIEHNVNKSVQNLTLIGAQNKKRNFNKSNREYDTTEQHESQAVLNRCVLEAKQNSLILKLIIYPKRCCMRFKNSIFAL